MKRETLRNKVKSIIKEILKKDVLDDKIEMDDFFADNLFDSLQLIQLIVNIENQFNVVIDGEFLEIDNLKNLDSICDLIERVSP